MKAEEIVESRGLAMKVIRQTLEDLGLPNKGARAFSDRLAHGRKYKLGFDKPTKPVDEDQIIIAIKQALDSINIRTSDVKVQLSDKYYPGRHVIVKTTS